MMSDPAPEDKDDPLAVLGPEGERELKRERKLNHNVVMIIITIIFFLLEYLSYR
jgi:hypothetical protein